MINKKKIKEVAEPETEKTDDILEDAEYQKLMTFIRKTDPDAFVTVYAVNEMMYKPKPVK